MAPPRVGPMQGDQTAPSRTPPRSWGGRACGRKARHACVGVRGQPCGGGFETRGKGRGDEDEAKADHQHCADVAKACFIEAIGLAKGCNEQSECNEGNAHACRKVQWPASIAAGRRGQNDGQDWQDAWVNQRQ